MGKDAALTPLRAILGWWESLEEFSRGHIAVEICFRLTPHGGLGDSEGQFRDFLTEELPANKHIGRVLAIRAVIDFWFWRKQLDGDPTADHLENVEGTDVSLKSLSNAALGRMPQVHTATDSAFDTWRHLRKGAISDASLVSVERLSRNRKWLG